jgi:tetratricopeptide (TPR) repeat protein
VLISRKIDRRLFIAVLAMAVFVLGARTYLRSLDWHDQGSISLAGTRTSPLSAKTWNNLAVQLAHSANYDEAVAACGRAIEIHPSYKMALMNRAFYNIRLGNFDSAEEDLRKLISLGTSSPEVYNKLGAILANRGKYNDALEFWGISLRLDGKQTMISRAFSDLQNEINLEEKK